MEISRRYGPIHSRLIALIGMAVIPWLAAHGQQLGCTFRNAASPTPSVTYILCQQGTLMVSTNGGTSWATLDTGAKQGLQTIGFLDATHGFVAGENGVLLATDDGGMHWQKRPTGVTDELRAISVAGSSAWVSGYKGVVLHSADAGRTWKPQNTGVVQALEDIHFVDPQNGWTVGWAGTILRTTNGGEKWEPVKVAAATWSLGSVNFRDAKSGWVVGFAGQILHSRDGGVTWVAQKSPTLSALYSVLFDETGHGWIATDEGFLTTADSGESWQAEALTQHIFPIRLLFVNKAVWALGQFGALKRAATAEKWDLVGNLVATGSATQILVNDSAPVQSNLQKGEGEDEPAAPPAKP